MVKSGTTTVGVGNAHGTKATGLEISRGTRVSLVINLGKRLSKREMHPKGGPLRGFVTSVAKGDTLLLSARINGLIRTKLVATMAEAKASGGKIRIRIRIGLSFMPEKIRPKGQGSNSCMHFSL